MALKLPQNRVVFKTGRVRKKGGKKTLWYNCWHELHKHWLCLTAYRWFSSIGRCLFCTTDINASLKILFMDSLHIFYPPLQVISSFQIPTLCCYSDFFTNLFLWVPGLTRPKFFASQTRSSASHMGPTLNHKFYVSIQIRPIHTSQFEKQDTVIITYTIKSKLTLSCKIIFRAQAISLCSSNSACLQVYCWSPWTYGDDTILIFVNTICSQYSPRTSWACSNTLIILFAELILGFV